MNPSIIIQARVNSSRLPAKMIMPFDGNRTLLDVVIDQISNTINKHQIIVATSNSISDDKITEIVQKKGIRVFRGSENNVLKRFINAAEYYKINKMIRVCADNPFINTRAIHNLWNKFLNRDFDYISYQYQDGTPSIRTHLGIYAEGVSLDALKKAEELIDDSIYEEHVTNYIYEHPNLFKTHFINVPPILEQSREVRLTIDTLEDFKNAQYIFANTKNKDNIEEILGVVRRNKEIITSMSNQINQNRK